MLTLARWGLPLVLPRVIDPQLSAEPRPLSARSPSPDCQGQRHMQPGTVQPLLLGIDLGATFVKLGLVTTAGQALDKARTPLTDWCGFASTQFSDALSSFSAP